MFSSFQGEGPYAGRRQVFLRFAGCPLSCFYCDTAYAREPRPKFCNLLRPDKKTRKRNPLSASEVLDCVKALLSPDLHSVCYTGGEPLTPSSAGFVKEIANSVKETGLRNFLETSGCSARAFASLADCFDFASVDIKLRGHQAVQGEDSYEALYRNELECVRIAVERGVETVVKVVVVKGTPAAEIEEICRDLSGFEFGLEERGRGREKGRRRGREKGRRRGREKGRVKFVLQPVTAPRSGAVPSTEELFELSEVAGRFLRDVAVIPQVHKFLGVL